MSVCAGDEAEVVMSGWGMARRFDPEDPELMDRPQPVSAALEKDLENLRGLNRWFGAWRIIRHWLGPRLTRGRALRIVDLCTGSGDLPILMVEMARAAGCPVVVDAVEAAAASTAGGGGGSEVTSRFSSCQSRSEHSTAMNRTGRA